MAAPVEEGGGGSEPRSVLAWGSDKRGVTGLGYEIFGGQTPYPQVVPGVYGNVVSVGGSASNSTFVFADGTLMVSGENEGTGAVGNGRADVNATTPVVVGGGIRLYSKEELVARKRPSGKWVQPDGPVGPTLTGEKRVVATVGNDGSTILALLANGEVVGWGSGVNGVLGNGHPNDQSGAPVIFEPEGIWPQRAPWYVQTGGPALVPVISPEIAAANEIAPISEATANATKAEAEAKRIKGVKAIALGEKCGALLGNDGEVYLTGEVAGDNTEHLFATRDDIWFKGKPTGAGEKAIGIVMARYGYLLILENHTVRRVGVNHSGTFGNGSTVEISNVRAVTNPGLSKVIAIATGEYFCLVLKDDFSVWAWGGNEVGQLGVGLPEGEIWYSPKEVTTLSPAALGGGKHVVAISAGAVKQGSGANNGDTAIALISDRTVRTWGSNWGFGDKAQETFVAWGALGDGTTEGAGRSDNTHKAPVQPVMADGTLVGNVVGIYATTTHMLVIQEPGVVGVPSIRATPLPGKQVRIDWTQINPSLPSLLPPGGYRVVVTGPTNASSGLLSAATTSWTTPVLAGGEYSYKVEDTAKGEDLNVKGGTPHWKAVGGVLTVSWDDPVNPQPVGWAQIVEAQRTATFAEKSSGKLAREARKRVPPEIAGTLRTATFPLPPPTAHEFGEQDLEEVDVWVSSNAEPAFGPRKGRFVLS